jgi:hypothetical protein
VAVASVTVVVVAAVSVTVVAPVDTAAMAHAVLKYFGVFNDVFAMGATTFSTMTLAIITFRITLN